MSLSGSDKDISFVFPKSGNLFYEKKKEFVFSKPHLMQIKSVTLEKLEKMQQEAQQQLKAKSTEQKDL